MILIILSNRWITNNFIKPPLYKQEVLRGGQKNKKTRHKQQKNNKQQQQYRRGTATRKATGSE
jgi:hypothetical protein